MLKESTYQIFPLGDSAATIQLGHTFNETANKRIIALFQYLQKNPIEGCKELIPAYHTLTIYFDVIAIKKKQSAGSAFDCVKRKLEEILLIPFPDNDENKNLIRIPVWYSGEDLHYIAQNKNIPIEEVVHIHSSNEYRVYMSGFLPGFAYMGEVDERIAIGRKNKPETILPGSIGIAGRQTGIYPFQSPGGWQIIGRTPLQIFNIRKEDPALLHAGDYVQFYPITAHEFENY